MNTMPLTVVLTFFIPAIVSFVISYRQAQRKGYIFHNTWVWASPERRESMDENVKNNAYRISKNVFFLLGVMFVLFAIHFATFINAFKYASWSVIAIVIAYAIVSSAKDAKDNG